MNISVLRDKRRVIPRWRSIGETIGTGVLSSSTETKFNRFENDKQKFALINEWENNKTLENANELLQHSLVLNDFSFSQEAINLLNDNKNLLPKYLRSVIDNINSDSSVNHADYVPNKYTLEDVHSKIHLLKCHLHNNNKDAFSWVELARMYTTIHLKEKAFYAIKVAYNIYPANRYILRSLIRLCAHFNEFDILHSTFKKINNLYTDPWLLAPFLSLNDKFIKPTINIKKVRSALDAPNKLNKTELKSSLATLEMINGSFRNAKKLYRESLANPNDNSLSQAIWASSKIKTDLVSSEIKTEFMFEPQTRTEIKDCKFKEAFDHSIKWINDEPFSSVPSSTASYIACAFLDQYKQSEEICRNGLISNPDEPILKNNYVYSLLMNNHVTDAREVFETIDIEKDENKATYLATYGLLLMKENHIAAGRKHYEDAINLAKKQNNQYQEELANIHLVRAELDLKEKSSEDLLIQIKKHTCKNQQPEIEFLRNKIKKEVVQSQLKNQA